MRRSRYGRKACPICGDMVTKNAVGRAAHIRWCSPAAKAAKAEVERAKAEAKRERQTNVLNRIERL